MEPLLVTFQDQLAFISEYVKFQPQFIVGARSWDEIVYRVNNGSFDIGVHTSYSSQRFKLIDSPSFIDYIEAIYSVPVPKPENVLYQFLTPFSQSVWVIWIIALVAFCTMCFFIALSIKGSEYFDCPTFDTRFLRHKDT